MNRVILQVPMDKKLKEKAEIVSSDLGFSSLQETLRVLVTKLAKKELIFRVEEYPTIQLSPKAIKKIEKALKDHKQGKTIPL